MVSSAEHIAGKLIKSILFEVVLKAVIKKIIAYLPFLGLPVINPIFVYLIQKLGEQIYEELDRLVAFEIIDYRTEAERAEYEKAAERLKDELNKEEYDAAKVDEAKDRMRESLARLIRLNVS